MDYIATLDQLEQMIEKAKNVPLSSSVVIPKDEALALIRMLRDALPQETERAKEVLADREGVIAEARAEAQKMLEDARAERGRLISKTEVMQTANAEADRIMREAEAGATKLKVQADDYVDAKLANFEILLNKTLKTVGRGREQLRRRLEAHQDEVAPLNLEDSGEFSGEIPIGPPGG